MKTKYLILLEKPLVMVLLALLVSSCYSYRSITKKEPITRDFLSKLEAGQKYGFELKMGETLYVEITSIKGDTIVGVVNQKGIEGESSYSESFQTIERNVARISVWKRDPSLTVVAIAVPVALFCVMIITSMNHMFDSFTL